ncbi:Calcineurin subunit b, partial [Globisporangium splendens]
MAGQVGPATPGDAFARFGKLSVKVLRALDLKKLGMMDTADPYVKPTIGAQNFQTKVHEKGGKNPEFNENFDFDISTEKELAVEIFDKENSGKDRFMAQAKVDIVPWIAKGGFEGDLALSNFSGAEKDEKLKFAFMVFDEDGNGVITRQELMKILKANHMASNESEVARKADTIMSQGDKDGDGVISFDEFAIVSKKFPSTLFPAYTLGTTKD